MEIFSITTLRHLKNSDKLIEFDLKNESLQKVYLQGRYGAIPFIGEFQF
ncbi:methionine gamma-lyase [Aphanothece sacrum FPU1]|uniref:Methionine gamma-lyase n=1 Tax=Aphanothece sacrum FPU1 TaxID=1920663 RepID=A0A401IFE8_APHSA|nr:methionine gamma-lyase [Aphanothece sacrum FPU1]GBF83775.1 methionine gamma-lyase [Aphanothece sacrum FPU3]